MSYKNALITIKNCRINDDSKKYLENINWTMSLGEAWLVTGANGSGKAPFLEALAGNKKEFHCNEKDSLYSNYFNESVAVVSLEAAASLIEEERLRDESEYMDKEDEGRTGRLYIGEVLGGSSKKGAPVPEAAKNLEKYPEVKLCGVEKILDRGLRYMSTGEIRRTLLCRALLSGAKLIILSDPFAGLDAESRKILLEFFDTMVNRQLQEQSAESTFPRIILSMERFKEIPNAINKVLVFQNGTISYCGDRTKYESIYIEENKAKSKKREEEKTAFLSELEKIQKESDAITSNINDTEIPESLISFTNVNVGWGDHEVLKNLTWEVKPGVHWLIRGPNGSGKTTILELITGDNMQVFREDIKLFGKRRGTGETIWDIKKQLGIVSYRLHVEYRMVGGTTLEDVIISGFYDSIGLYQSASDYERSVAKAWLKLAGFNGRENEIFSALSYGEQRAILILRAAVKKPRVLILDEPCHGLDENYREKILDLVEKIGTTGTTTLLHVTHDPSEVLEIEKHVLELHPQENPMYKILGAH